MTMPREHASDQVKEQVAQYVRARLLVECEERGKATKIAKATGFTPAAVANAKNHARVGADLARGLAKHWGMTIDQLEAVALGKSEEPDPSPQPPSSIVEKDPPDACELRHGVDVVGGALQEGLRGRVTSTQPLGSTE